MVDIFGVEVGTAGVSGAFLYQMILVAICSRMNGNQFRRLPGEVLLGKTLVNMLPGVCSV